MFETAVRQVANRDESQMDSATKPRVEELPWVKARNQFNPKGVASQFNPQVC